MPNPEEYRRTRRIVDLLLVITRQPRRWTRRRLAERYEVSEQQMDKDIQLIRHGLRMPLGHCSEGYYFEQMTALPALTLTLPEALSLLLAARLGQHMPGVSGADLSAAVARLETLLPEPLLPIAANLERSARPRSPETGRLLELQLAIAARSRLQIVYHSASHEGPASERDVDPYTLLPYQRSWYLVGFCHRRREVRIFKVDRIRQVARTGETFDFPEQFDLDMYLGGAWGLLRGEAGEPEEVVLEFEPGTGRWLRDQELHPSQRVEETPDTALRLRLCVGITPEFRRWVLGFGRSVRVVSPASLAGWVTGEARWIARESPQTEERDGLRDSNA